MNSVLFDTLTFRNEIFLNVLIVENYDDEKRTCQSACRGGKAKYLCNLSEHLTRNNTDWLNKMILCS